MEDAQTAVQLGVNAVGLVFYPPSPRAVSSEQAREITAIIPPFVSVVALVVNIDRDELLALADDVAFDVIQFHGDETARACQDLAALVKKRWYKALRVQADDTAETLLNKINELKQHGASAVLLDAYHPNKFGGTGEQFDWHKIPVNSTLPIILAGGLTADNVGLVQDLPIYGVDVSGGIESAKGIKCEQKMQDFIKNCQRGG